MRRNIQKGDEIITEIKNVTAPNKEASLDSTPELTGKIVNAAIINLRDDISDPLSSEILDTLYYGETVKILQQAGNVCKVKTKTNKIGYVFSKYVEVLSDVLYNN